MTEEIQETEQKLVFSRFIYDMHTEKYYLPSTIGKEIGFMGILYEEENGNRRDKVQTIYFDFVDFKPEFSFSSSPFGTSLNSPQDIRETRKRFSNLPSALKESLLSKLSSKANTLVYAILHD